MRPHRIALLTLSCTLPFVLALTYLGTTSHRIYWFDATDGNIKYYGTVTEENDNGDFGIGYMCWAQAACRMCSFCHTNGQDRSGQVQTIAKHNQTYYPRAALSLAETQRLSWAQGGGYLTRRAGKLEFHRNDGTVSLTAPNGSLIFKDAAGKPFVLWMPGEPTLTPKPR